MNEAKRGLGEWVVASDPSAMTEQASTSIALDALTSGEHAMASEAELLERIGGDREKAIGAIAAAVASGQITMSEDRGRQYYHLPDQTDFS